MKSKILIVSLILTWSSLHCYGEDYTTLIKNGIDALRQDSLSKAEGLFLQAIDTKPSEKSNIVLYQYLGELRVRQKRHKEALEAFSTGLQLNPAFQPILLDRASLYIETNNLPLALCDLNDILTANPDNCDALFFRAYIYAEQKLNSKARIDYEHLITLQPRHQKARIGLALLCDNDKRPHEAMEHMDVLLRYWPDNATIYTILVGIFQKRRQYEMALKDINTAIELEPENPDFYISRALLYKDFRKNKLALADFRKAVALGASAEECASLMIEPIETKKK